MKKLFIYLFIYLFIIFPKKKFNYSLFFLIAFLNNNLKNISRKVKEGEYLRIKNLKIFTAKILV